MKPSEEDRPGTMIDLLREIYQIGAWTGIVISRMIRNMLPASVRSQRRRIPHFFDDRRRASRLRVDRNVTCMRDRQDTTTAHLINISRGGMYVEADNPANIGQEMYFNLSGRNLGPFMRVRGQVTRKAEHGMAIRFV